MTTALHLRYTYDEYVRFEDAAHERHDFVDGLILAMAGGSIEHAARCAAIVALLSSALEGRPCRVFDSNARVRVRATGNAFYPDATVVCGRLESDPDDDKAIANPIVVVEVLSPSTEAYHRTDKLVEYRRIPSLAHVLFVGHDVRRIDVWTREADQWTVKPFAPGESAGLNALGVNLSVERVYRDPLSA